MGNKGGFGRRIGGRDNNGEAGKGRRSGPRPSWNRKAPRVAGAIFLATPLWLLEPKEQNPHITQQNHNDIALYNEWYKDKTKRTDGGDTAVTKTTQK